MGHNNATITETETRCLRSVDAFKAIADGNRIKIINMLSEREMCAIELLEQLEISQPTLSHHMKVLALASIVKTRKSGAQVYYSINVKKMAELSELLGEFASGAGK